eukprot:14109593-Alexandrium_andersonii.AAC.1
MCALSDLAKPARQDVLKRRRRCLRSLWTLSLGSLLLRRDGHDLLGQEDLRGGHLGVLLLGLVDLGDDPQGRLADLAVVAGGS